MKKVKGKVKVVVLFDYGLILKETYLKKLLSLTGVIFSALYSSVAAGLQYLILDHLELRQLFDEKLRSDCKTCIIISAEKWIRKR